MPVDANEIAAGFVEEDAYLRENVPEPSTVRVVSPRSLILGVDDEELENTVFTKVKMRNDDFRANPRKLPRLIFINKESLLQNPALAGELSPLVIALTPGSGGPYFTLTNNGVDRKLAAIMRDSFLLLPLYASNSRGLQPWGTDMVFRDRFYPSPGKLRVKAFNFDHLFLFGKKYDLSCRGYGLQTFWRSYSHWPLKDFMGKQLAARDIDENIEPLAETPC